MVALDRGDSSTFVYQIDALGLGDYKDVFWDLRDFFLNGVFPDVYIYLDVDVDVGLQRVSARSNSEDGLKHFDEKPVEFHHQLRRGFKEFLARVPHVVIDANRSEAEVFANVLAVLEERFSWYKVEATV
jgi:dTMP kinase